MNKAGDWRASADWAEAGDKRIRKEVDRSAMIWLASLVILPYVSYLGLLIMLGLWVRALRQRGRQVWQLCIQRGFGWLSMGLIIISCFAWNRGESFLQLVNFLPFFLFFGVLATVPSVVGQPVAKLETLARWLLLTAVPMSAIAVVEYGLKFESLIPTVKALPLPAWLLSWLYEGEDFGHRAHSVFSHPNGLSAYLVIVLGLGLGLIFKGLNEGQAVTEPSPQALPPASMRALETISIQTALQKTGQLLAVTIALAAIFCTGSRNGVLISLVLVAIALYAARRHRWVMLLGLMGGGAIATAVLSLGIGGRSLSLALITQDPRVGVWQLALDMIQQRLWLGWGFAAMRIRYDPGSILGYDMIYHAHNVWLYLASEAGIPLTVAFCAVIGTIYYDGIKAFVKGNLPKSHRSILLGYLLAFASCLLFSLFDVTLFDSRVNILSYGLLASIYILSHTGQKPAL